MATKKTETKQTKTKKALETKKVKKPAETKKTETKQTKTKKALETKKVKKPAETKKTETKQLEITYIYHEGDDIAQISKQITGKSYMEFKLLSKNGKDLNTLKDGDVLKWEL